MTTTVDPSSTTSSVAVEVENSAIESNPTTTTTTTTTTLINPPLRASSLSPPRTDSPVNLRIDTGFTRMSTPPPIYTTPSYEAYCETAFKLSQPPPTKPRRHLLKAVFILRCILDFQLALLATVVFILGMLNFAAAVFITKTYEPMNIIVTFLIASTVFVPLTERYLVSKNHEYECYGFEEGVDAPEVAMTVIWAGIAVCSAFSIGSSGGRWWNVGWEGASLSVLYLCAGMVGSLGRTVCTRWYGIEEGSGGVRLDEDDNA